MLKTTRKLLNKKDYLKKFKWAVKWTKGKRTQIMRWEKDNLQNIHFLKNAITIP